MAGMMVMVTGEHIFGYAGKRVRMVALATRFGKEREVLNRRNVVGRPVHHPSVAGLVLDVVLGEVLDGGQEQRLLLAEHDHALDRRLQSLARIPEVRALPILLPRLSPATPLFERMTAAEALGNLKATAALAMIGPKLRAALWKVRLPQRSA